MSRVVQNKKALVDRLRENSRQLKAFGVSGIRLFGSFLTVNPKPTSDVDLLVEFEPDKKTFDNFMGLSFFLEELLGRSVELVTPQSLNKHIGPHILKSAEPITFYEKEQSTAHDFLGVISSKDAQLMDKAIEEGCEQIDPSF